MVVVRIEALFKKPNKKFRLKSAPSAVLFFFFFFVETVDGVDVTEEMFGSLLLGATKTLVTEAHRPEPSIAHPIYRPVSLGAFCCSVHVVVGLFCALLCCFYRLPKFWEMRICNFNVRTQAASQCKNKTATNTRKKE